MANKKDEVTTLRDFSALGNFNAQKKLEKIIIKPTDQVNFAVEADGGKLKKTAEEILEETEKVATGAEQLVNTNAILIAQNPKAGSTDKEDAESTKEKLLTEIRVLEKEISELIKSISLKGLENISQKVQDIDWETSSNLGILKEFNPKYQKEILEKYKKALEKIKEQKTAQDVVEVSANAGQPAEVSAALIKEPREQLSKEELLKHSVKLDKNFKKLGEQKQAAINDRRKQGYIDIIASFMKKNRDEYGKIKKLYKKIESKNKGTQIIKPKELISTEELEKIKQEYIESLLKDQRILSEKDLVTAMRRDLIKDRRYKNVDKFNDLVSKTAKEILEYPGVKKMAEEQKNPKAPELSPEEKDELKKFQEDLINITNLDDLNKQWDDLEEKYKTTSNKDGGVAILLFKKMDAIKGRAGSIIEKERKDFAETLKNMPRERLIGKKKGLEEYQKNLKDKDGNNVFMRGLVVSKIGELTRRIDEKLTRRIDEKKKEEKKRMEKFLSAIAEASTLDKLFKVINDNGELKRNKDNSSGDQEISAATLNSEKIIGIINNYCEGKGSLEELNNIENLTEIKDAVERLLMADLEQIINNRAGKIDKLREIQNIIGGKMESGKIVPGMEGIIENTGERRAEFKIFLKAKTTKLGRTIEELKSKEKKSVASTADDVKAENQVAIIAREGELVDTNHPAVQALNNRSQKDIAGIIVADATSNEATTINMPAPTVDLKKLEVTATEVEASVNNKEEEEYPMDFKMLNNGGALKKEEPLINEITITDLNDVLRESLEKIETATEEKLAKPEKETGAEELQTAEAALGNARAKYFKGYKKHLKDHKPKGFFGKIRAKILGYEAPAEKDSELDKAKQVYEEARVKCAQIAYNNEKKRLEVSDKPKEEIEKELKLYKIQKIFKNLVIGEIKAKRKDKIEEYPPQEKGILKKSWEWYAKKNKVAKIIGTTALITGVLSAGGLLSVAAIPLFATKRIFRSAFSLGVGASAGKLTSVALDKTLIAKGLREEANKENELRDKIASEELSEEIFKDITTQYEKAEVKQLRKELYKKLAVTFVSVIAGMEATNAFAEFMPQEHAGQVGGGGGFDNNAFKMGHPELIAKLTFRTFDTSGSLKPEIPTETIERGGNVWNAAKKLVKDPKEFSKAWGKLMNEGKDYDHIQPGTKVYYNPNSHTFKVMPPEGGEIGVRVPHNTDGVAKPITDATLIKNPLKGNEGAESFLEKIKQTKAIVDKTDTGYLKISIENVNDAGIDINSDTGKLNLKFWSDNANALHTSQEAKKFFEKLDKASLSDASELVKTEVLLASLDNPKLTGPSLKLAIEHLPLTQHLEAARKILPFLANIKDTDIHYSIKNHVVEIKIGGVVDLKRTIIIDTINNKIGEVGPGGEGFGIKRGLFGFGGVEKVTEEITNNNLIKINNIIGKPIEETQNNS